MHLLTPNHTRGRHIPDKLSEKMHYFFKDHAVLRYPWSNMSQVAHGVWRSNQPTLGRLKHCQSMGIEHILSLRGSCETIPFRFESAFCEHLGLKLYSIDLRARAAPSKQQVMQLFAAFDLMPRPFLMHCKSGADRAGFASAVFLLHEGHSISEAKAQLSWRYVHLKFSKAGILDHILDLYAAEAANMSIKEWFFTRYSPEDATESFAKQRRGWQIA